MKALTVRTYLPLVGESTGDRGLPLVGESTGDRNLPFVVVIIIIKMNNNVPY